MTSRSFGLGFVGLAVATLGACNGPQPVVEPAPIGHEQVAATGNADLAERPVATVAPNPAADAEAKAREIYNRAVSFFEEKEWDVALVEFQRALRVDPSFYKAHFKIALCYYNKQKYDLEIEYYNRCLEIKPDYLEALLNLGNALLAQDQLERAVTAYHRVLDIDPKSPVALFNLGLIYYDLQQYESSAKCLQRYLDANPNGPDRAKAQRHLARAHEALDRTR